MLSNIFGEKHDKYTANNKEEDEEYKKIDLGKYFPLCRQSTVYDPLQWWNDICDAFPVLY